jgi:hypothetical protein
MFLLLLFFTVSLSAGLSVSAEKAQRQGPVLIIRDTGGISGPDYDFQLSREMEWTLHEKDNKAVTGVVTAKEVNALLKKLNMAGLKDAKSIDPSPKLHSQIL